MPRLIPLLNADIMLEKLSAAVSDVSDAPDPSAGGDVSAAGSSVSAALATTGFGPLWRA